MFPDFQKVVVELETANLTIQLWPHDWHSHWAWPVHWVVAVVQLAWHSPTMPTQQAVDISYLFIWIGNLGCDAGAFQDGIFALTGCFSHL